MKCEDLYGIFEENGLDFFSGVPDSTFKSWMSFLDDKNIVPAVNECEACGVVAGYHLATGKVGVVYMQNSGLGKTVNPGTSLLSKEVYGIPAFLMIGWRGEGKDEPQHKMMGRIMKKQLEVLEIPYEILPDDVEEAREVIKRLKEQATEHPVALIVRKGVLEKYREKDKENEIKVKEKYTNELNLTGKVEMSREDAIKCVLEKYNGAIVSTTGKASRELFEEREKIGEGHERDFLTVGSMGCASAIGLGIAVSRDKEVYVFDGDGSALMQMGSFATIGSLKLKNLKHIIFDNQAYDSTGGQRTVSGNVDFGVVALGCGYDKAITVDDKDGLGKALDEEGLCLIRVLVKKGARKDLGRPTTSTFENKKAFMEYLRK